LSAEKKPEKKSGKKSKSGLRENIEAILIAIVRALFIRTFVIQAFKIPSGSMKQTLQIGDHILVNKFIYGVKIPFFQKTMVPVKDPERGDTVVFKFPEEPEKDFIKRVVGLAGDTIEIRSKKVYINREPLNHDFGIHTDPHMDIGRPRDNFGPIVVPDNSLFVMGDNRDGSHDSRFWGLVPEGNLVGKAFMIWFNWDVGEGLFFERIGQSIE